MAAHSFPNPRLQLQLQPRPAPDSARSRRLSSRSGMAASAGSAAKENAAPPTSAVAASRRHGSGVKSCGGVKKRPCRARLLGRVPLRDITNLMIEAMISAEVSPDATTELTRPDVVLPAVVRMAAALQGRGEAAAPAVAKAPRYSLRKGYR